MFLYVPVKWKTSCTDIIFTELNRNIHNHTCIIHTQENTGQTRGPSGLDLNVEPAWMQGITGEGVIVGIVDDGMLHCCSVHVNYDPTIYVCKCSIIFSCVTLYID